MGVRTKCLPKEALVLQYFANHYGHLYRGRRPQISKHSDSRIFNGVRASFIVTWVQEDSASLACPTRQNSMAITSRTFAAVNCDADAARSVQRKNQNRLSQRHLGITTTRHLCFWNFCSISEFSRWHKSIQRAFPITSSLLPTFFTCHASIFFCNFLQNCGFRI